MLNTMGIRIPKVPQEVPVAKDKAAAMIKMIAGKIPTGILFSITWLATKSPVSSSLRHTPPIVQARIMIVIPDTMD